MIITDVFFRRGLIEQWGRGTQKIIELCVEAGRPTPEFEQISGAVVVRFRVSNEGAPEVTPEVVRLLYVLDTEMKRRELQERIKLKDSEHFRTTYLKPALQCGMIEMTIPDKPNSKMQKYRLTVAGKDLRNQLLKK